MEKLSIKEALDAVNSLYDNADYQIKSLRKKQDDTPPDIFKAEMGELLQVRQRVGSLREIFLSKLLHDTSSNDETPTNCQLRNMLQALDCRIDNLWRYLVRDAEALCDYKKEEDVKKEEDEALAAGEFEEKLAVPTDEPFALSLRHRRLDYVVVKFDDDVSFLDDTDVGYCIDTLNGVITFDGRLAGYTMTVRYKLA